MKKLLDTNIFLEILLAQPKAQAAQRFINSQQQGSLALSNYSLDGIGLKLYWAKKIDVLEQFGRELKDAEITILTIEPQDLGALVKNIKKWNLDFDDAYQYTLAQKYSLELVSFDKDFDKTDIVRIEPN
jgi:predicted nucleic acid-binding protein